MAESIVELRQDVGGEGSAVGEPDAASTHAQLLAEKRIGFLLLTLGLGLYVSGLVLKSSEDLRTIALVAAAVLVAALVAALAFTRFIGRRIRDRARRADERQDPDVLPEQ